MKILVGTALSVLSLLCMADFLNNPDENTLWCENGKDIKLSANPASEGGWGNSNLNLVSVPEGGFTIEANGGKGWDSDHYVPVNADYPYLVLEIAKVEARNGYKAFSFGGIGCVGVPEPGIYIRNQFASKAPSTRFMIYQYVGLKIYYKSVKVVKKPENLITVDSPAFAEKKSFGIGDTLKFTVELKDDAEDVSLQFYDGLQMRLIAPGKQDKLQLKPVDKNSRLWTGEIKVTDKGFNTRDTLFAKAIVLGSDFTTPLYLMMPFKFKEAVK